VSVKIWLSINCCSYLQCIAVLMSVDLKYESRRYTWILRYRYALVDIGCS